MHVYTRTREKPEVLDQALVELPGSGYTGSNQAIGTEYTYVDLGGGWADVTWKVNNTYPLNGPFAVLLGATTVIRGYHPWGASSVHSTLTDEFAAYLTDLLTDQQITPVTSSYPSVLVNAKIEDNPTKNFKKIIAAGGIVNTAARNTKNDTRVVYSKFDVPTAVENCYVEKSQGNYSRYLTGIVGSPASVPAFQPPTEALVRQAEADAASLASAEGTARQEEVNKAFGKVNAGTYEYLVELAEMPETLGYLASTFTRIASMMKSIKRGHYKDFAPRTYRKLNRKAKRLARKNGTSHHREREKIIADFAGDAWMELRFGVRPLVYGVDAAIEHYNAKAREDHKRITVNSRNSTPITGGTVTSTTVGDIKTVVNDEWVGVQLACAGVLLQVDTSRATIRDLGFTNISGALWELTFASWAVDYFVNLDGLLYHLTPNVGVKPLTSWSSVKREVKLTRTITRYSVADDILIDTTRVVANSEYYSRLPNTPPGFIFMDIDLDFMKALDLAGLFRGVQRSLTSKR